MKKILTLCIIHDDEKILLGMKKRGFGEGRWNGFGGKVAEGETIEEAAKRELKEEANILANEIEKRAIMIFEFENDPKIQEVHIYKVKNFSGEPIETEEMRPNWFNFNEIPFEQMWSDDIFWLPKFIEGKKMKGKFLFDRPATPDYPAKILSQEIIEVEEI